MNDPYKAAFQVISPASREADLRKLLETSTPVNVDCFPMKRSSPRSWKCNPKRDKSVTLVLRVSNIQPIKSGWMLTGILEVNGQSLNVRGAIPKSGANGHLFAK
jgi:hypothetical protein